LILTDLESDPKYTRRGHWDFKPPYSLPTERKLFGRSEQETKVQRYGKIASSERQETLLKELDRYTGLTWQDRIRTPVQAVLHPNAEIERHQMLTKQIQLLISDTWQRLVKRRLEEINSNRLSGKKT
jgi:hypothetical protein